MYKEKIYFFQNQGKYDISFICITMVINQRPHGPMCGSKNLQHIAKIYIEIASQF